MPPSRRPGLSALLIGGAIVLLVSIVIGQRIGDKVLLLQTERRAQVLGAQVTPVPEADASDRGELKNWKRLQVVSVATDPAFPDPRVTRPPAPPPPPVTPTPRPTRTPRATPIPVAPPPPQSVYTSPPLPIPLVSHEPVPAETDSPTAPPESQPE